MKFISRSSILANLLFLLASGTVLSAELDLPPDIQAVIARALGCRDWKTVEITDEASDRKVQAALVLLQCDRLTGDVLVLRRKYEQAPSSLHDLDSAGQIDP